MHNEGLVHGNLDSLDDVELVDFDDDVLLYSDDIVGVQHSKMLQLVVDVVVVAAAATSVVETDPEMESWNRGLAIVLPCAAELQRLHLPPNHQHCGVVSSVGLPRLGHVWKVWRSEEMSIATTSHLSNTTLSAIWFQNQGFKEERVCVCVCKREKEREREGEMRDCFVLRMQLVSFVVAFLRSGSGFVTMNVS
jgi:hypothetical protein